MVQAWTRYKITNKRLEVCSGFQGKDVVQVIWREITDVKWLRRYGGAAGDLVFSLQDGSKLEVRSVPDFDRNLAQKQLHPASLPRGGKEIQALERTSRQVSSWYERYMELLFFLVETAEIRIFKFASCCQSRFIRGTAQSARKPLCEGSLMAPSTTCPQTFPPPRDRQNTDLFSSRHRYFLIYSMLPAQTTGFSHFYRPHKIWTRNIG